MTTHTGMSGHWKLKYLNRLIALTKSAYELISEDKRTEQDTEVLLDALQAFKLNQLRGVVRPLAAESTGEDLFKAFSMTVEETPFTEETKKYLLRRGVRYIGEIFYIVFDQRKQSSRLTCADIFRQLGSIYGLKRRMDPFAMYWKPPYWDDQFMSALDFPVLEVFGAYDISASEAIDSRDDLHRHRDMPSRCTLARRLHGQGIHFLGQYLTYRRKNVTTGGAWLSGRLESMQKILNAVNAPVWAAALVPAVWWAQKSLQEVPAVWLEEQAKIEQEKVEGQTQREQEQSVSEGNFVLPMTNVDWLFRPVDELMLSVRSSSALRNAGFKYIGEVVQCTRAQLLQRKHATDERQFLFSNKTLREVEMQLERIGLGLDMTIPILIRAPLDALVAGSQSDNTFAP